MSSKMRVLQMYKLLLREGEKFTNYNFRTYAIRRIRDAFHEHKFETDAGKIDMLLQEADKNLAMLKRQAIVSQLYTHDAIVIEQYGSKKS